MWLLEVSRKLTSRKVRFALAGGYAVALHGAVRGTVDIDIVIATDEENLSALEKALGELGLVSRIPVTAQEIAKFRKEYIAKRNLIAWSFIDPKNPSHIVDAIIAHEFRKQDVEFTRVHGEKIPILAIEALIAMKEKSGRPQDLEDARALREIHEKN